MKKYYYLMDISQALIKPRTSATLHFNSVTFVCIPPLVHIDAHKKDYKIHISLTAPVLPSDS